MCEMSQQDGARNDAWLKVTESDCGINWIKLTPGQNKTKTPKRDRK